VSPVARTALRFLVLVTAYLSGAQVALWFVQGPDQVTLIWPPSGVVYGALLLYGLRWWPFVVVSVLATHWLMAPVPPLFLPYSVLSNVIGGCLGAWYVLRFRPLAAEKYTMGGGFTLLSGGLIMVGVSAVIGTLGMWHAGMVTQGEWVQASLRWAMGDLFGVLAVAPAVILAARGARFAVPGHSVFVYGGWLEKAAWLGAGVISLLALQWASRYSDGAYALGLASLPLALLLWSALRFEPLFTALANVLFAMLVATVAGLGLGGFTAPSSMADVTLLIAFLCVIALTPQVLSAAAHENRVAALRLLHRARTDALTGLPNRVAFEERVRAAAKKEAGEPMALAYLDLDQFKLVNDILSHKVGDELIRSLAGALQSRLGPHDVIARTGGDEFALLLRHCPPGEAEGRVQRLRDAVAEFRFASGPHVAATTASAGVVVFTAGEVDYAQLLAQADTACFAAKERGGNRMESVTPGRSGAVEERSAAMRWALRLNEAMEQDRFELFCQSIAPLRAMNGHDRHFEILLRLRDTETGKLLPPGQFIPAAERFGLGMRLDTHVLDRTLQWFERHPEAAARVSMCSINLSAASVDDERFLAYLQKRLQKSAVPPQRLCFELTETSALRDLARAQHFIQAVRALGCKFALDDFGTGFCSFGYLRELDVDFFKIDGSFVREVDSSPLSLAIVRSIADIGRVMKKETIAECAETEVIRRRLMVLGVDYAQGYAVDEPMPIERYFDPATVLAPASAAIG
jgi:diguanylate cyclase (GGDEF)-like protein